MKEFKSCNILGDDDTFFKGTILRNYYNETDYYDYMLVSLPWDKSGMVMVNITSENNKAGSVYGGMVPYLDEGYSVNLKGFKHAIGNLDSWHIEIQNDY